MPRHPEPEQVAIWRKGQPKCCHTCLHYSTAGECLIHHQEPPQEFAASEGACDIWEDEDIPF